MSSVCPRLFLKLNCIVAFFPNIDRGIRIVTSIYSNSNEKEKGITAPPGTSGWQTTSILAAMVGWNF